MWTLTANGKTVQGTFGLHKGYQIEPFMDAAMGNKPPTSKFEPTAQGPDRPALGAVGRRSRCRARPASRSR